MIKRTDDLMRRARATAALKNVVTPKAFAAAALSILLAGFVVLSQRGPTRASADGDSLLEVGRAPDSAPPAPDSAEFKIVSYNIRYRAGEDLQKLIKLLREDPEIGGAAIIGLQEVDRNKKRTRNVNTVRRLADALGMHYAWAAPPDSDGDGEEETGVALLSKYPLTDVQRVLLTHEGPDGRRRVAVGATVQVGPSRVRVYSVHAETRMPIEKKVEHWRAVLDDLRSRQGIDSAVVVGDLNTIKGKDVRAARRLFEEAGFTTPFPDNRKTWKTLVFKLKLDWVWVRGLEAGEFGIDKEVGLSDHWPLWAKIKLARKPGDNASAHPSAK